jgi:hypothetical protein
MHRGSAADPLTGPRKKIRTVTKRKILRLSTRIKARLRAIQASGTEACASLLNALITALSGEIWQAT